MPTSEQVDAYRNADYVVFADREFVLRIGEPSTVLDELMQGEGATTAAFITAANPRGERRADSENGAANAALQNFVATAGYPHYWGDGRDPFGSWSEPSFLVIATYPATPHPLPPLFHPNPILFL